MTTTAPLPCPTPEAGEGPSALRHLDAFAAAAPLTEPEFKVLAGELADLLYHSLVLCAERGLPPSAVIDTLKSRHRA